MKNFSERWKVKNLASLRDLKGSGDKSMSCGTHFQNFIEYRQFLEIFLI